MSRYRPTQTAHGWAILDATDLGNPVIRSGLPRCPAEVISSLLNDLNDDNVTLRAMLRNQGLEVRPAGRAS